MSCVAPLPTTCFPRREHREPHLQEEDDASVGHGVGQPQDPAAHNGIAEVKHRHPKGGLPFELHGQNTVGHTSQSASPQTVSIGIRPCGINVPQLPTVLKE